MTTNYGALVVGAGVGGIRAALDLAQTGQKVALIDQRPHLGGLLSRLDFQFPSDHCGMCKMLPLTERDASSQFCMRKGLFHKNVDVFLGTELVELEGEPGTFLATLRKKSTFVDPTKCIGCGECSRVCPVHVPSEFNSGLTMRSAVHLPVPHQIPNHYVVDMETCERCWKCYEACPTGAIDFRLEERKDFPILLVDREESSLKQYRKWFEDLNFPFLWAGSGEQALDMLGEDDSIRMLLLDMSVNDITHQKIINRAKELRPDLEIIVLAGPTKDAEARELVRLGARDYRLHPLKRTAFVPWLDKHYLHIMSDEHLRLQISAVVLAGGFECYDPTEQRDVLGYGLHDGVVTSLEFERLASGSGPSQGKLATPGGRPVRKIAWLQCVGSRDLKHNADYCSSYCCMVSLKEARLAKKMDKDLETTIFYMDMRTFGKGYERYRKETQEKGVRLVRSRIHSVIPAPKGSDGPTLTIQYIDDQGDVHQEAFDMVVLAVGARPPRNMDRLQQVTGIETNEFGFCTTEEYDPSRTGVHGVFAAGSFGAPRDITETVIQSGAAALEASRLINLYAPLRERTPEDIPEYRDISREPARILVTLCSSCPSLDEDLNMDALRDRLGELPGIAQVVTTPRACTPEGWQEVQRVAKESKPNRVLIGACMPYAYVPKLRELGAMLRLNPAMMDVVDVVSPLVAPQRKQEEAVGMFQQVVSTLRMAAMKLLGADPAPLPQPRPVSKAALVVGGGLAGMTAAVGIADHGYHVTLVERSESLGGLAMHHKFSMGDGDPARYMEDLVDRVEHHPNITVHKDSRVALTMGRAGKFMSVVATPDGGAPLEHGATILATGGKISKVYGFGFLVRKTVFTQMELEQQLASGALDLEKIDAVAMIQCWRSGDQERTYCSRVCCANALKNVLALKAKRPDLPVYVFYRDMMSYGFQERFFTKARQAGAVFFRYDPETPPKVTFNESQPVITAHDPVLRQDVVVQADILALSCGVEPEEADEIAEIFGVPLDADGFYQEAERKWRPVDFLKQGVFHCGLGRAPGNMGEIVASSKAAAQRALCILSEQRLTADSIIAEVRHSLCSLCGRCVEVCPYGARSIDLDHDLVVVDELLCQGCGSCAAVCPNSASYLRGFRDKELMSTIDAALEDVL